MMMTIEQFRAIELKVGEFKAEYKGRPWSKSRIIRAFQAGLRLQARENRATVE